MNTPVNLYFTVYIKVGCKGVRLHGYVSMMVRSLLCPTGAKYTSGDRRQTSLFSNPLFSFVHLSIEESVLLWRGISLKVICEKVKLSNCKFCSTFCYNEQAYM